MTGYHVVTTFHPVLVNGEPYIPEPEPERPDCYCRRCYIHDDPGGCLVQEAVALVEAAHVS